MLLDFYRDYHDELQKAKQQDTLISLLCIIYPPSKHKFLLVFFCSCVCKNFSPYHPIPPYFLLLIWLRMQPEMRNPTPQPCFQLRRVTLGFQNGEYHCLHVQFLVTTRTLLGLALSDKRVKNESYSVTLIKT